MRPAEAQGAIAAAAGVVGAFKTKWHTDARDLQVTGLIDIVAGSSIYRVTKHRGYVSAESYIFRDQLDLPRFIPTDRKGLIV